MFLKTFFTLFLLTQFPTASAIGLKKVSLSYLPGIQAVNTIHSNSNIKAKYGELISAEKNEGSFGVSEFSPVFVMLNLQVEVLKNINLALDFEANQYKYQLTEDTEEKSGLALTFSLGANFNAKLTENLSAEFGFGGGMKSWKLSTIDNSEHSLGQMLMKVWVQLNYSQLSFRLENALAAIAVGEVGDLGSLKDSSFLDVQLTYSIPVSQQIAISAGGYISHDHTELFGAQNPAPHNAYMIDDLSIGAIFTFSYNFI